VSVIECNNHHTLL